MNERNVKRQHLAATGESPAPNADCMLVRWLTASRGMRGNVDVAKMEHSHTNTDIIMRLVIG